MLASLSSDADPLQSFVRLALMVLGAEHSWREEALVLVWPHPALEELFGELPAVELALSPTAADEHPTALLCVPGSFAFDRLVEAVRAAPAVYHTGLAGTPGPPDGFPHAANATLETLGTREKTAAVVFALFRAGFHSDELIEHLVPLAFDRFGVPRSLLAARIPAASREPSRSGAELPEPLLAAMEAEASRAAAELAREHLPAVEERRAREVSRLEAFLRELRDEVHRDVPAGAARRAAQARADSRALLDSLRTVLPGAGPWDRKEILDALRPHGLFHRRHKGPLDALPAEMQVRVPALISTLPERFDLADAQRKIDQLCEDRVRLLETRAGSERSPVSLLEEREQELEAEHRRRLADIDQRFHLRVLVRPLMLERLDYPLRLYRFRLVGRGAAELEVGWDPLMEAWERPPCPSCADPGEEPALGGEPPAREWWLCERDHLACERCASVCAGCRRARCAACAFRACAVCAAHACDDCGRECGACGKWACGRHAVTCPECALVLCSACGAACAACGRALCPEHHAACAFCRRDLCAEHALVCHLCEQAACGEHGTVCPCCGRGVCEAHRETCRLCGQDHCACCSGEGGRCETCRDLEEVGPETAAALRSRLEALLPEARLPAPVHWWLARNRRYTVIAARRWLRNRVFVVDEESGEVVARRTYLSWRRP